MCPAETQPVVGFAAMATLMRLLSEADAQSIEEWSECARARGLRVADHAVPLLLDWWSRQPQHREMVWGICGKRAEWLASLNPAWGKTVVRDELPANAEEIWQTGSTTERVVLLRTTRKLDPSRALEMVHSTWASDTADERRRFIETLSDRLSMDDEPFLESALDDRSKNVRRAAAMALAMLSESRHKGRINALARTIIVVDNDKSQRMKTIRVTLQPPSAFDKAWERDGLEEQAPGKTGKRAWWMRQILIAADLSVWAEVTELDPAGVLETISEDDFFPDAMQAIVEALKLRPNAVWIGAVVQRMLQKKKVEPMDLAGLIGALQSGDREPLLLHVAQHGSFSNADRWELLTVADYPWTREFSQAALDLLAESVPPSVTVWGLSQSVERISRLVSPELAEKFAVTVEAMFADQPSESFKRSIDRARLRADMHKELAK